MKIIEKIKKSMIKTNTLFENNKDAIKRHNEEMLPSTLIIAAFIMIVPIVFAIFRESIIENIPAYLITFVLVMSLFFLFRVERLKKHSLIFIYILGIIYFTLVCYLSLFQFSLRPAGTALTFFVVVPLLVIDRPYKINTFVFILYIIHMILAFQIKGFSLGSIDLLNTSVSFALGILFGRLFLNSHLNTFETKRLLTIEKQTDFLTQLKNRRKLFYDINIINKSINNSVGFMIIDIDNFKEYNDKYGHTNGDLCLIEFGTFLLTLEDDNITFYRFGGEEFIGVIKNKSKEDFISFAEDVRRKTNDLPIPFEKITSSIGLSYCSEDCHINVEDYIIKADNALYRAKKGGRNRVELEE